MVADERAEEREPDARLERAGVNVRLRRLQPMGSRRVVHDSNEAEQVVVGNHAGRAGARRVLGCKLADEGEVPAVPAEHGDSLDPHPLEAGDARQSSREMSPARG